LFINEAELFVPFSDFPWFKDGSIAEITRVELPSPHHLYWPDLDIDLAVDSIQQPDRYPLVSQAQPDRPLRPTSRAQAQAQIEGALPHGSRLSGRTLHLCGAGAPC
jgi:hypothetical protein